MGNLVDSGCGGGWDDKCERMGKEMNYVHLVRRISALRSAQIRALHYADRHPETDIDFEIADKIDYLKKSIKDWYTDDRPTRRRRSKQVRLACKLLRVDYHNIMR